MPNNCQLHHNVMHTLADALLEMSNPAFFEQQ
jgi:hypothetical protein